MGLRLTKGDGDAKWGRQFCLQPPFRRLVCKSQPAESRLQPRLAAPQYASVFKGAILRNLSKRSLVPRNLAGRTEHRTERDPSSRPTGSGR